MDAMKKILVVDDDPTLRKLVSETLKREGYEVTVAKDGIDAMVSLKQARPDLMVLDVMMPEVNGYDVCHNIKFDDKYKDIPILLFTTRDQELDPRLAGLMGIGYLNKTCAPSEVVLMVQKMLA
jgi:DNA-binding response OmpR family regulator